MSRLGTQPLLDPEGFTLCTPREINRLPQQEKERIYSALVPEQLFVRFGIDRLSFCGADGARKILRGDTSTVEVMRVVRLAAQLDV